MIYDCLSLYRAGAQVFSRCLISERGFEPEHVLLFVGSLAGQNKGTIFFPKVLFPYLITLALAVIYLHSYVPLRYITAFWTLMFFIFLFTCASFARRRIQGIDSVSQKRPWIFLPVFTPAALLCLSLLCADLLPLPSLCRGNHA